MPELPPSTVGPGPGRAGAGAGDPGEYAAVADHLVHDVLAWWLREAPDRNHGGVFTCWDNAGERLLSTDKYTWSQGRWTWLLAGVADAVERGVLPGQGVLDAADLRVLARQSAAFVRTHAVLPDATTAYVTDAVGTPHEPAPGAGLHTSVFADCFAALGLAAWARVGREFRGAEGSDAADAVGPAEVAEAGKLALTLLESAAARVRSGQARTDPYPIHPDFTALSLPMICVGTATEVYAATGAGAAAAIAAEAGGAIAHQLREGDDLRELIPRVPGREDTLLARHRTPGHALECLWFLLHAADTVPGVADALGADALGADGVNGDRAWIPEAALHALRIGWDDEHGGLFRYVDRDGGRPQGRTLEDPYEVLVRETWDTKLWWPHAEALYATRLLAVRFPAYAPELSRWHERLRSYTYGTFPAGRGKEWVQIRSRDGTPLDRTVALPVKDPFHIARALLLQAELLAAPGAAGPRTPNYVERNHQ
ncbi:N-acylglucosamine 2-epimerase [Actinopolymorpha cephalotaxi]|uniref:N-acylglucosamine 2-epimerase n=1 Tax=Actinopolymorpha cephalotaxi TaxID=504797 RepID=A0A1I2QZQ9_9ACTN|nr:AGE family epimerase/isomerase [Actinopolymorpha cephalotaxi]NYH82448.1 N-acylglucosamine 2-epimerase [Actinopolymorpha cephalotaxi]SFG32749.1 N-acylglucosamine 2-epimerase [Actinopolymorpha cephalotaxi]